MEIHTYKGIEYTYKEFNQFNQLRYSYDGDEMWFTIHGVLDYDVERL